MWQGIRSGMRSRVLDLLISQSYCPKGKALLAAGRTKTVGGHTPPLFLAYFSGCWANSSRHDWEQK